MKSIALICFLALAASVVMLFETGRTSALLDADGAAFTAPSTNPAAIALRKKIATMSTDEKIGQIMMVAIPDATLSDATAAWLRDHHIGGIILLGQNILTEEQTKILIRDLQGRARNPSDPPLFIAVDQEGGAVSRFLFLKELTGQREIIDSTRATAVAAARGAELHALGVNINFSPVLDVASSSADFIYSRAFRGDAVQVAALGTAMIRGYEKSGIIAVAKHFPGHGGTAIDSHKNLPTVSRNASRARDALLPFRSAVKENAPIVMMGHIKVPEIDDKYPASLSPAAINILRSDLGFRGIVITDDLGMGAITKQYALSDAIVQSVRAGADIALVVRNFRDYDTMYEALKNAAGNRDISEAHLNQSVARILLLKQKFLK